MSQLNRVLFVVSLIFLSTIVKAEIDSDQWQWSGFVTQGWSISDRNNVFGRSSGSNGTFSYRELGVNANYQLNGHVSVNGQVLSRWVGETDDGKTDIDYLFADWAAVQKTSFQAGARLGRIKNTIGFYNDTRDVAFTRPSALLPQSIYQDRVRELFLASDGMSGYLNKQYENGELLIDLQWGKPQVGRKSEISLLGRNWDGGYKDPEVRIARIVYDHNGGEFLVGLTLLDAKSDFLGRGSDPFSNGFVDVFITGLSGQYNFENFTITGELFQEKVDRKGFNNIYTKPNNTVEAFYVQADYRLDRKWTLFTRYDEVVVDRTDKDGKAFQTRTGLPAHQRFAKDWTIGVGYQYSPKLLLRGEVHHVDGTAWLSSLDNPNPFQLKRNWNLFLFQASYRF